MKIKRMIRILESVLQEKGNVEFAILDNDTDALFDVTRVGMTDDGRLAVYGLWSAPAPFGRIADVMWEDVKGPIEIESILLIDEGEVQGMVDGATPVEITDGVRFAGRGSVVFDAEGRITRIVWDEEE